jgi:hypothetical protein
MKANAFGRLGKYLFVIQARKKQACLTNIKRLSARDRFTTETVPRGVAP